jgi:hypothetical protein
MNDILTQLKNNIVALIITTIVAIFTLFSDKILGDIKFELNKADLRVSSYEKFTVDISSYVFDAENVTEYYQNGWTTLTSLNMVTPAYNNAIDELRSQEYVTYELLHRFWKPDDISRFEKVMETVKKIDTQIHSLNSEAESVKNGTKKSADPKITMPVVKNLNQLDRELENRVKAFFLNLVR